MKGFITWPKVAIVGLMLIMAACVVQRSPVTGSKRAYGYTWEQEKQMGDEYSKQVEAEYGVYQDQGLQNYVKGVAQKVLAKSDLRGEDTPQIYRDTPIHYEVLDNPVVNAFTLPGGYIYVDRGLLANVENEAQLAMVIGHETGHAAARHSAQSAFKQQIGQIALLGGAVAGQAIGGIPGGQILQLGGQAEQLLFLKYSRDDEREADQLGVKYSAKAGYKAADGAGFFGALKRQVEQSGQSVPEWQQTHPDPGERINNIQKEAAKWKEKGYDENTENQDAFMKAIDNMVYGDNPRQGFTRSGHFYHPELKFQFPYPQSWQLVNGASSVQIVNQDGDAIIVFQIDSKNSSPQASVNEFLNQDGITAGTGSATSSNGLNGYQATATGKTENGEDVKFYLYGLSYNGNIYRFVCYTLSSKFSTYTSTFANTTKGFSRLTDSSILNIQPARLHVYRADRTGSFQSFLPSNLPLDIKPEDVAIANQVELNETIQKGTWIKIPR